MCNQYDQILKDVGDKFDEIMYRRSEEYYEYIKKDVEGDYIRIDWEDDELDILETYMTIASNKLVRDPIEILFSLSRRKGSSKIISDIAMNYDIKCQILFCCDIKFYNSKYSNTEFELSVVHLNILIKGKFDDYDKEYNIRYKDGLYMIDVNIDDDDITAAYIYSDLVDRYLENNIVKNYSKKLFR